MELDVRHPVVLRPGEGETIADRPTRTVRILVALRLGDETHELPPGGFACVPPGNVHTFSNPTSDPVLMLNLGTPAGFEQYLKEVEAVAPADGPPDPDVIAEIASRYDFHPV